MNKAPIILPSLFFFLLMDVDCYSENAILPRIPMLFGDTCNVQARFFPDQDVDVTSGNPIVLTNQSVNANSYSWYINGSLVSSSTDFTISPIIGVNEIYLVASNGSCQDTSYSYILRNGAVSGGNGNLKKQFRAAGYPMDPFCIARDRSNGYLIAGDYELPVTSSFESRTTGLFRIDENGCVLWSATMMPYEEEVIQTIISTSDTGYLVSAFPFQAEFANYPKPLLVFKLDKSGNVQWERSYGSGNSVTNYLSSMYETDDKGFIIESGSVPSGSSPSYLSIIKIDPQGNVVWGHLLSMENDAVYNIGGIIEKNGFIYATGSIYENNPPFQLLRSFLTQLNMSSGQTTWTMQNDPSQSGLSFTDLHVYKNGLLINSYAGNLLNYLIYTDNNGNILSSTRINNPYGSLSGKGNIQVAPDNGLYFHQYSGPSMGPYKDILMRLDSNQLISWQHDFYLPDSSFLGLNQLAAGPSNAVAAIGKGMGMDGLKAISFLKLDSTGEVCSSASSSLSISNAGASFIPMNWITDAPISIDVVNIAQYLQPLTIESHLFCPKYISGCDLLKLDGPKLICQLNDTVRYVLHSDPSCLDPITWSYTPLNLSIISKSPQSLEVKFRAQGTYVFKVEKNGCNDWADSIIVLVGNIISREHLPLDTTLCTGHTLTLDAGAGFASYLWQDGTTQQAITVSTPGRYWVTAMNLEGCVSTDTSMIDSIAYPPANFLPADTSICNYETLQIHPGQTYSTYLWNTGETTASIEVKTAGEYTLEVVDKNGCQGEDTIRVTSKNCPYGIYFPNAFTPNKDGHNDLFRPVVIGNPIVYHFSIFNRLGQRIFDSSDPKKGWDGRFGGRDQESGGYVWICNYQFGGEAEKKGKGNFVLIR
jgi:gliding motility-associated-like protein